MSPLLQRAADESGRAPNAAAAAGRVAHRLVPIDYAAIDGFDRDDHLSAFTAFSRTAQVICMRRPALRPARPPSPALVEICRKALVEPARNRAEARQFFTDNFRPCRVVIDDRENCGFLTGYFEPLVDGRLEKCADFPIPLLARPDDLVTLGKGETVPGVDPDLRAARKLPDGTYTPYPERAMIEVGAIDAHARPVVWLRDRFEAFMVQVQGSARVRFADGSMRRLVYAGRNGQPYSSLGRILVDRGEVAPQDMGLERLRQWIYDHGLQLGDDGAALMLRNKSYVFFALETAEADADGPIGGAGVRLTPLRSIAVDRSCWSYGLPVWLAADLPWQGPDPTPFRRLMIAQDTGSAILGPARADLFFGAGDFTQTRAGDIRHPCNFTVFLPRVDEEDR